MWQTGRRGWRFGGTGWLMGVLVLVLGMAVGPAFGQTAVEAEDEVREAIVKVFSVSNAPDYYNPWNMRGPRTVTGSGVIIDDSRILTNAHVVSDATFVQVRRYGETERYMAEVAAVSHQSDLAILSVADESFFAGVTPLSLGALPRSHEEVAVFGFPLGGDTLSITKGVVSRIEHQPYVHSSVGLLAGQIDAAINPGNSGGPVILGGQIVGVIMQGMPRAQSIGYMVPVPVIEHFLTGIAAKEEYGGFPSLGVIWQRMENADLRSSYGMEAGQTGVLVNEVLPGSPAEGKLKPNDVILACDSYTVANDGTVEFRPRERTSFSYVIQQYQLKETMALTLLRDRTVLELEVTFDRRIEENWLVPREQYETMPSYFIYGGLVFVPLSKDLLQIWGSDWFNTAPTDLVALYRHNTPEVDGEQVILILRSLADAVNVGYQHTDYWIIRYVNGERVYTLQDLVYQVTWHEDEYTVFESPGGRRIVFDHLEALRSTPRILEIYRIPADRSDDLK